MRVLDLCCGTGVVAAAAVKRGAAVTGLDFSAAMLAEARRANPQLAFDHGDTEALPYPDGSFDAVVDNFGVHHAPYPARAVAEAQRALRPGGRFAFTTWAAPEENIAWRLLFDAVRAHGDPDAAKAPPSGGNLVTVSAVLNLLREAGFAEPRAEPIRRQWLVAEPRDLVAGLARGTVRTAALILAQPPEAMTRTTVAPEVSRCRSLPCWGRVRNLSDDPYRDRHPDRRRRRGGHVCRALRRTRRGQTGATRRQEPRRPRRRHGHGADDRRGGARRGVPRQLDSPPGRHARCGARSLRREPCGSTLRGRADPHPRDGGMASRLGPPREWAYRPGHRTRTFPAALLLCRFPEYRASRGGDLASPARAGRGHPAGQQSHRHRSRRNRWRGRRRRRARRRFRRTGDDCCEGSGDCRGRADPHFPAQQRLSQYGRRWLCPRARCGRRARRYGIRAVFSDRASCATPGRDGPDYVGSVPLQARWPLAGRQWPRVSAGLRQRRNERLYDTARPRHLCDH